MKKRIAIIGSGTAGLHLGYALQTNGSFEVTILTNRTPDEYRNGRILSTQVHFGHTRLREQRYGMPTWTDGIELPNIHVTIGGQKLFVGALQVPAMSVDQRHYMARYMEDLAEKGVKFRYERVDSAMLNQLAEEYDLIVDCSGKTGPIAPFPVKEDLSPLTVPQRKCHLGYFFGVTPLSPAGVSINVLPGSGELFEIPALTEHGPVTILFIEAVPNGPLDVFRNIKTPEQFTERMLDVTKAHFPHIHDRVDQDVFALCDESAYLQIALKPAIRTPYTLLQDKLIVGCGDSVILNDPITGQGSNTASFCAEQLYLLLAENPDASFDENLGAAYWGRVRDYAIHVSQWCNAMMAPLPEHIVHQLLNGAQGQTQADEIANWFENPNKAYQAFYGASV